MPDEPLRVEGRDLRVGDTIEVWWQPRRDTIVTLEPYRGPLDIWDKHGGALVATFAIWTLGMTIEPHLLYEVLHRVDR